MTRLPALTLTLALTLAAKAEPPSGFHAVFNGKDLTGWVAWAIHEKGHGPLDTVGGASLQKAAVWMEDAKKHWSVENGELVNDGHGAYLATAKEYGDVELLVEYKTVPKADSGIYLRATPQVQIWDKTNPAQAKHGNEKGSGGLWNNSTGAPGKDPLVVADKPFGEWNQFRIVQVGERTTIHLNGQLVVDHARMENFWDRKKPLFRKGSILLQTHGGEIRWRNVYAREIPPAEANEYLRARATKESGFRSVFDGKSLAGWAGAVDSYEVADGAIVCKPKKGGVLHTTEQYGDFTAVLEYKTPKGGNNGLAVRYPGTGDTAYGGMCELQVLDDTDIKYANLDPRQANGSAYGMVAAHRGYARPAGEWNFEQVTVKGSTIQVELNGTRILDADLSKVTEYMANRPHPGKNNRSGHFGFAGHNDPVAFRHVLIKRLDGGT